MFKTIKEKRNYYSNLKFKKQEEYVPDNTVQQDSMTGEEITTLQRIVEASVTNYKSSLDDKNITEIPYITNNATEINVYQESRKPYPLKPKYQVREILIGVMAGVKSMTVQDFRNDNDPARILLILHYPIEKQQDNDRYNLKWNSWIVNRDNYDEYHITDPILYPLVKRYSRHVLALSNTTDLFIPGMDIANEIDYIGLNMLEDAFRTLAKTVFVTTLLGRNLNVIDVMDYPAFNFGLGTYKGTSDMSNKFYRVVLQSTLLHVVPLWQNVITISFTIELPTTKVIFAYDPDTLFSDFKELYTSYFPKITPRSQNITNVATNVVLHPEMKDTTRFDVYNANINVRNNLSSRLDKVKNWGQVKDKMYPKNKNGARVKLESLLENVNMQNIGSALDIGSAPGTWMESLIEKYHIKKVHGITQTGGKSLKMYDNILKLIHATPNCYLHYDDLINCDISETLKFDLIISDAATYHSNYVTQSVDHEPLFLSIIEYINKLNVGGTFIMKVYDITNKLYLKLQECAKNFKNMIALKPKGSCPTNPEMYILMSGYKLGTSNFDVFEKQVQLNLYNQIYHIHNLVVNGFKLRATYKLIHFNSRLSVSSIRNMPHHLQLCLLSLKFSDSLFSEYLEGVMSHDVSQMGDKYIRFNWIVPSIPYENMKYVTETTIAYESNNIGLQQLLVFHTGFIIQHGKRIEFIHIDKTMSCLFSDKYTDLYLTTSEIQSLNEHQITFPTLVTNPTFRFLFPSVNCFYELRATLRYLVISAFLHWANVTSPCGVSTILKQFFREAETMHLSYKSSFSGTTISNRFKNRVYQTIDLETQEGRLFFWQVYQENKIKFETVRQIFSVMFEKYTIKIPNYELLQSSMCYITKTYTEYSTGQICLSQPACVQYRRQNHV